MVTECYVLLRVQHLQEGRRRISPKIAAHFVDFVKKNYRVLGTRLTHSLDNPARKRTNVGAPVSPDFSLVPYPAKRKPDEFPAKGAGY